MNRAIKTAFSKRTTSGVENHQTGVEYPSGEVTARQADPCFPSFQAQMSRTLRIDPPFSFTNQTITGIIAQETPPTANIDQLGDSL